MKKIFLAACLSLSSMICAAQNSETAAQAKMKEAFDEQLISCVKKSDAGCVARALAAGADVNAKNEHGRAVLFVAAEGQSVEIVRLLINAGADVNKGGDGDATPLCRAALFGRAEIVETLLKAGAKINVICDGDHGDTPLMEALSGAWLKKMPNGLSEDSSEANESKEDDGVDGSAGAEANDDEKKLREIAKAPHEDFISIARLFIARGADVNVIANCDVGETALLYAAMSVEVEMVKEILAHGAHVEISSQALTVLQEMELDLVKMLYLGLPALSKEQSAMIEWSDKTRAAREEIKQLLRAAGAKEVKEEDDDEKTDADDKNLEEVIYQVANEAFHNTIEKSDTKDLERLIDAYIVHPLGARVLPEALRTAVIYDRPEMVKLLLARGVEPNSAALMHAVHDDQLEYVLMLLEAGVDVNATDKEGRTALDNAEKWTNANEEHRAIIEALKAHGARSKSAQ